MAIKQYIIGYFIVSFSLTLTNSFSQSGMLDPTFGNQGIVITDINQSDFIYDMIIQPDQKILTLGYSGGFISFGGAELITVARYLPDGSLDQNFGDYGISIIKISHDNFDACYAMALQSDGRVVLAGRTNYDDVINKYTVDDFALLRLNSNGSLDSTFGNAGIVITDIGGDFEQANSVLIQDDGKIIAAGLSVNGSISSGFTMVRYDTNGVVDLSFGTEGIVRTSIQGHAVVTSGVIQPDGKIILAGYARTGFPADFAMARYQQNGTIDSLFGTNGIVQTDIEGKNTYDLATSMLLEPNGKIVLAGDANFTYTPYKSDIGVVRYNSDGSLDDSFGNNGVDIIHLGPTSQINSMALRQDGKYILTGTSNVIDSTQNWLLVRLLQTGEPDITFGNQGIVLTDIEGDMEGSLSVAIQNDSKIVVGGANNGGDYQDFVLARYIADDQTGIQNISPLSFSIYPNPCTNFISVDLKENSGALNCTISDLFGRTIMNETLFPGLDGKILFDTRQLNSGYYLLGLTNNVKSGVASFVVEK